MLPQKTILRALVALQSAIFERFGSKTRQISMPGKVLPRHQNPRSATPQAEKLMYSHATPVEKNQEVRYASQNVILRSLLAL